MGRVALASAVLAAIAGGVLVTLREDRTGLERRFRGDQEAEARLAAEALEGELLAISEDLTFTSRLLAGTRSPAERTRALEVLLSVVRPYRMAAIYEPEGVRSQQLVDEHTVPTFEPSDFHGLLDAAAQRAHRYPPGEISTLPGGFDGAIAWFRTFATALPPAASGEPPGALVVLVDTALSFKRIKFASGVRPLLVRAQPASAEATDPGLQKVLARSEGSPAAPGAVSELLRGMRAGESGAVLISVGEAAELGWGESEVVAAFAPVKLSGETLWTVGIIQSTLALRQQERALVLRLSIISAAILACVLALALFTLRANRREGEMRAQLRHAEEVALLTSQLLQAEKLATVGMLAAGIAHEIGTPLGVVRARAELLTTRLGEGNPLTAGALVIVEQIDRITRTIRQLLAFSQPQAAEVTGVSMAASARQVVDLLQYEASSRNVALEVEVAQDLPPLAANPDQLQQVLVNLVMNACDACDAAGKSGRVVIRASSEATADAPPLLRIEVADTGCGVSPELRHRIFDPFFTTKKRGKGTGLGLTIAAQIVRNHGGRIDLDSHAGQGTRVLIEWPTQPSPSEILHANAP